MGGEVICEVNSAENELRESILVVTDGLKPLVGEKEWDELAEEKELAVVLARCRFRDIHQNCRVDGGLRRRLTRCQHGAKLRVD